MKQPSDMPTSRFEQGMLQRYPDLKLRTLEPTAAVGHQGMEREVVKWYFEAIRLTLITRNKFDKLGANIWNIDETGIVHDHKPMKVPIRSGTKSLQSRSSAIKEMITVIAAVNASGGNTPLYMISMCFISL